MDGLFALLGLAALAAFVLGPIGFFKALSLKTRLELAERRIKDAEQRLALQDGQLRKLSGTIGTPDAEAQADIAPAPDAAPKSAPDADSVARQAPDEPVVEPAADMSPVPTVPVSGAQPPSAPASAPALPEPKPAAPGTSWEEKLGTRWSVIVGGIALALGLVLLVRIAIENGLLGPGPRTILGLLFSAALAAGGEWLRRREELPAMLAGVVGPVPIPAVLTAVATVGAFGSVYAAYALYGLIPPALAFVALGVVAVAGMLAAVLHGPALAGLGLAASLVTPLLVQSGSPQPWPVMVYIAVVSGAAYWLARTRRWLWLAGAASAGAAIWGLLLSVLVNSGPRGGEFFAAAALHALLHLALAVYVFAEPYRPHGGVRPSKSAMIPATILGLVALFLLAVGVQKGQFGVLWVVAAVIATGLLALPGSMITAAAGLVVTAALFILGLTRIWPHRPDLTWSGDAIESALLNWLEPMSPMALLGFTGALALGLFALCADRLRKPPALPVWAALTYAATATATPVIALGFIWLRHPINIPHYEYAAAAGALAVLFVTATGVFRALGGEDWRSPGKLGTGFFAVGALASLALGATIVLNGGHLTVALALSALAAAWISQKEGIPALRWAVAGLGIIIAARLAWDPRIVGVALSTTPIFNWLLIGYGVPALAFAASARLLRRDPEDLPVQMAQALAIVFAALLCFYEIRHALNGGNAFAATSTLTEDALHACMAFGFAIATTLMTTARKSRVFSGASLIFGVGAVVLSVFLLLLSDNPFFDGGRIEGGGFFNSLILAYALPALLAAVLSRLSISRRPGWYRTMAAASAILLAFAYINLQTRRFFLGDNMSIDHGFLDAEFYAYSAIWLALGLGLLAYGIVMQSREARFGSALLVVGATLKIFLFDMSRLEGAIRALSFIGLGLVLIGIGMVYQKLLFRPKPVGPEASPPAEN